MKPWLLPRLSPNEIPFYINEDWSPEQAMAVVQLLDELRDAIYNRYKIQLQKIDCKSIKPGNIIVFQDVDETDPPF